MGQLQISGQILTDEASLKAYSADMSHYSVKPKMIAVPASEDDLSKIIDYAREESVPVTPRGAGSNLSGSAVGSGIIVLFSKMNRITRREGRNVSVQPGTVHKQLDEKLNLYGLRIPYDPSSKSFCTIGGNIGTKASGLRSLKYGTADAALKNLRFFDTAHGLVDTSQTLPENLEADLVDLKKRLRRDTETRRFLEARRKLKSSSGYNLQSFYEHEEPGEILAHLLAGSVGTLGVFSEIELEAVPLPASTNLYLVFFDSLSGALKDVAKLKSFKPSAIEVMDSYGVELLKAESEVEVPSGSKAVLMVEFDSDLDRAGSLMRSHLNKKSTRFWQENDPEKQAAIWKIREAMLLWIINSLETSENRFPIFADDIAVPLSQLPDFVLDVQRILKSFKTIAVIYGHAGEGNLHIRPMVSRENWRENLRSLSNMFFTAALKAGGTITGEHGLGRNRSMYLRIEWGDKIYQYFVEIKKIFDPAGLLNPGVVFTSEDLTKNLQL
jgi:glycolate oxidase